MYETAFDLAWKVMKDYLETEGFVINSPREAIKQAFQSGLIEDDLAWIDALTDRDATTHIYEEPAIREITGRIQSKYFSAMKEFHEKMKKDAGR